MTFEDGITMKSIGDKLVASLNKLISNGEVILVLEYESKWN